MSTINDRLPPQSREAERSVLGSMLRHNPVIDELVRIPLRPEHFYFDAHQKLFQAILDANAGGRPVDLVLLSEALKARKQLDDVGGDTYLADLWDAAPTAANALYYSRIVIDKAAARN